ncbi:R3H and coiled-coil domain-containing protein 1 [Brienomyrus brachyistius]|uniref:R3H and coiled-coil domain-containing protein 1 n=1 Tax=Brienomyrus brachyistius TaxID=42636 RepID=UPI0020B45DAC|nr:R3H and coiled-coil domain-containing protein 1 [Brienomyrus brachyistius]
MTERGAFASAQAAYEKPRLSYAVRVSLVVDLKSLRPALVVPSWRNSRFAEGNRIKHHTPLVTLAFNCFDGYCLPQQECEFVDTVQEELDAFLQRDGQKSVLLFPPLPSRLRYLIHRTVESCQSLGTFSVGEGWSRRVVVCPAHLRLPSEEEGDLEEGQHEDFQGRTQETEARKHRPHLEPRQTRSRAARRPDKAIYVPRAMRDKAGPGSDPTQAQLTPDNSGCSPKKSTSGTGPEIGTDLEGQSFLPASQDTGSKATNKSASEQEVSELPSDSSGHASLAAWDQTLSNFMAMSLKHQALDESGSPAVELPAGGAADLEDFTQEIIANLREADPLIESARNDYSCYQNMLLSSDEFAHVIEIYDFPKHFKTEDLLNAFAAFSEGGLRITWVDDTCALGVFSSESAAQQALSIQHPLLKARRLTEGSRKAKGKAFRRAEFIQPVKERPRTDTAVARRLVTRALGLQRGGVRGKRS